MQEVIDLLLAEYGLDPSRGGMVRTLASYVEGRLEALGLGERAFVERVRANLEDERARLIHAITVRHSWFYRDPGQLEQVAEVMQRRHREAGERIDVWVAGCASGEEAWTVAMLAADLGVPARVLATDVDSYALVDAEAGRYGAWSLRELPERLWRFLRPIASDRYEITDELRAANVEFVVHNLCDPAPDGSFDVISCRNVLIYFDPLRARAVAKRLRDSLRPGGELILGAGDLLFRIDELMLDSGPLPPIPSSVPTPRTRVVEPRSRAPKLAPIRPPARVEPAVARVEPEPEPAPTSEDPVTALAQQNHVDLCNAGQAVLAGDYHGGLGLLADLVERDPLLVEAHLWAGIALYGLARGSVAADALRRARCLAPQLWPATLFAALNNERLGRWRAANRCWVELERILGLADAPPIEGTPALLGALPDWRTEAHALARRRISKHADPRSPHD